MGNFMDFNDAGGQRERGELIPAGALCKCLMNIRPGGEPSSEGYLTQSKNQDDVVYLDCEFTVLEGEYAKRKFWQNLTLAGGKKNDKGESTAGNISRATIRAMLESSRSINPSDMGQQAAAARQIASFKELDGIEIIVKVGVEKAKPGSGYSDKNQIALIITPDKEEYAAVRAGTYTASTAAPQTNASPGWQTGNGAPQQTTQTTKQQWADAGATVNPKAANGTAAKGPTPTWAV